ncbi:Bug family tripartite tricarboxylate transporter substrate binding protein [Piscinibacter sp.]|uniref:Bug family tripartite tricarboxylate transporter substrate binding protein n=1 Tax=Piscinibacter sp. TaxID=1903157 RepID=UPI002C75F91C|nr:Bug family tripartite tricarboxylate transporter substrate binding protein [Albitalea sp.]HUG24446.1 Bug family tripartite tricarboxylate transporter substrate binding protein [Albitalea sp.]
MKLFRHLKTVVAGLSLGIALAAQAQDKPPLRLIVGFAPGGSTDTVARVIADKLRGPLGQPVIVENKPGAGGRLAAEALKNSAPDGQTYMIAPNATGVFQALLYPVSVLRYDLLNDLAPVAVLVSYPLALAVGTKTGVDNVKEYVAYVKGKPERGMFGSAGLGGHTHFSGLQLAKAAGVELNVVPYKGNGPLAIDLLGGQVPAGIMTAGDIAQHQKTGDVKLIGVFGAERSPLLPEVPTLIEQGYNVDTGNAWIGMWAPAKTPKAELDRMQAALKQVLDLPDVRDLLINKQTMQPDFRPAAELDKLQRKELAYWGPVIKSTGFKPEQ